MLPDWAVGKARQGVNVAFLDYFAIPMVGKRPKVKSRSKIEVEK